MLTDEFDATGAARELIAARDKDARIAPSGPAPDLAGAYAVQTEVMRHLGAVAGYKVALKPGTAPIFAPIAQSGVQTSGARVAAPHGTLGVELEVGLRLLSDPPPPDAPGFDAALARILRPVAVIEIVDTRLSGPAAEDPMWKLADNQINGGLILGDSPAGWDGAEISTVQATLRAGDSSLLDGPATVPGGGAGALATLAALIRALGVHCGGLRAGQVVITGSLHPLTWVPAGTHVAGRIEGIGAVEVQLG